MNVRRALLWGLLLAVLAGVVAVALSTLGRRGEPLPDYGSLPPFELLDSAGRPAGLDDLAGRPWIADFIFTRCVAVCPMMSLRMAELDRELPAEVALVSITVDPEHDTPEVLARYAERLEASERWSFLTGEPAAIYELSLDGFHLAVDPDPPPEMASDEMPILHSARFALVDAHGRIRGYYDSMDRAEMERLARDAARLAG